MFHHPTELNSHKPKSLITWIWLDFLRPQSLFFLHLIRQFSSMRILKNTQLNKIEKNKFEEKQHYKNIWAWWFNLVILLFKSDTSISLSMHPLSIKTQCIQECHMRTWRGSGSLIFLKHELENRYICPLLQRMLCFLLWANELHFVNVYLPYKKKIPQSL